MYWSIIPPSASLACVWYGDAEGLPGAGHRSDPVLGPDIVVARFGNTATVTLQGPVTHRTTYPHVPGAEYFGIRFHPGVGSPSPDVELAEVADRAIEPPALHGLEADHLATIALGPGSRESRARELARVACAASLRRPDAVTSAALAVFRDRRSSAPVRSAAAELGVTERHLQRLFRSKVGVPPKLAARMVRIADLLGAARGSATSDLAWTAHRLGFADQAHMSHETRRFLGTTPSDLFNEAAG